MEGRLRLPSFGESRMFRKHLLPSLCLAFVLAECAHGQGSLDAPLPTEPATEIAPRRPLFGQIARNLLMPFRPAPQLLPPQAAVEPTPSRDDIARMIADGSFSPAQITAAKIKADEAQANARQAAVRYLATVDCNYYPEAEAGLIAALRADRSENVRYEAAVALGSSRGATRRIIDALNLSALGQDVDGNPPETSERVRQAARASLNRVLAGGMAMYPVTPPPGMPMDWADPYAMPPVPYPPTYPLAMPQGSAQELERAETISTQTKSAAPPPLTAPPGPRSLIEWIQSFGPAKEAPRTPPPPATSPAGKNGDPRLRGLRPLGSDMLLSMPNTQPVPAAHYYLPAYNDR